MLTIGDTGQERQRGDRGGSRSQPIGAARPELCVADSRLGLPEKSTLVTSKLVENFQLL